MAAGRPLALPSVSCLVHSDADVAVTVGGVGSGILEVAPVGLGGGSGFAGSPVVLASLSVHRRGIVVHRVLLMVEKDHQPVAADFMC